MAVLIVASLWGGVLVYWLLAKRAGMGDSIRSFRYELTVLERTAPRRVSPANRLRPFPGSLALPAPANGLAATGPETLATGPVNAPGNPGISRYASASSLSSALLMAARNHQRQELRRRRRDVLSVLAGAVVVSSLAVALTGSSALLYLQLVIDLALASYVYLLAKTARAHPNVRELRPAAATADRVVLRAGDDDPAELEPAGPGARAARASYGGSRQQAGQHRWEASYGDFDSYAELALARAN